MHLNTMHVESWPLFIEEHQINLACPDCKSEGQVKDEDGNTAGCEECGGTGYIEPLYSTVWNTEMPQTVLRPMPAVCGSVFAFEFGSEIWFGLAACGMNLKPELAHAWVTFFPDCRWIPDNFCVTGCNLLGRYVESCIGKEAAKEVYARMEFSYRHQIAEAEADLKDLAKVFRLKGEKR